MRPSDCHDWWQFSRVQESSITSSMIAWNEVSARNKEKKYPKHPNFSSSTRYVFTKEQKNMSVSPVPFVSLINHRQANAKRSIYKTGKRNESNKRISQTKIIYL